MSLVPCAVKTCALSAGDRPTRQTIAPAGGHRSGCSGNEATEAFEVRGHHWVILRTRGLQRLVNVEQVPKTEPWMPTLSELGGRLVSLAKRAMSAAGRSAGIVTVARVCRESDATREVLEGRTTAPNRSPAREWPARSRMASAPRDWPACVCTPFSGRQQVRGPGAVVRDGVDVHGYKIARRI